MMRFCVLGSGSKGNATYVEDGETAILIDAGFSGVEVERRLAAVGVEPGRLSAIVLTHEHSDHVRGVGVLSRKLAVPVYGNAATLAAAARALKRPHALHTFVTGRAFTLGRLTLHPFVLSHDAAEPVGLVIEGQSGRRLGYCTDTGFVSRLMRCRLAGCHALILEANHDPDLLRAGPYPPALQQRVRSKSGHLANHEAAEALTACLHPGLQHVVLAHVSEANNHPTRIERAMAACVAGSAHRPALSIAGQERPGPMVSLGRARGISKKEPRNS